MSSMRVGGAEAGQLIHPPKCSKTLSVALGVIACLGALAVAGVLIPHIGYGSIAVGAGGLALGGGVIAWALFSRRSYDMGTKSSLEAYRDTYAKKGKSAEKKVLKQTAHAVRSPNDSKIYADQAFAKMELLRRLTFQEFYSEGTASLAILLGDSQEDGGIGVPLNIHDAQFFGIFDGHSDQQQCAKYIAAELPYEIEKRLPFASGKLNADTITGAITTAVKCMEEATVRMAGGTTATCALIIGEEIYVINVGDSRAILVKERDVYQLSEDADPSNERFSRSVHKMGHTVEIDTSCPGLEGHRVDGRLAVARDIGYDFVSAQPKITRISSNGEHNPSEGLISYQVGDYLVLASDGLWDMATNDEVAAAIREMSLEGKSVERMSSSLVKRAGETWKQADYDPDDISVLVVKLGSKE